MSAPDMLTIAVESVAAGLRDKPLRVDAITEARITLYGVDQETADRHGARRHVFSMVHFVVPFVTANGVAWYPSEQAVTP